MRWLTPSLMVLLLLTATASTLAGTVWLSPHQAFASAFSGKADLAGLIVTEIRLPRVMLAIAIGASLGLSGAVLQGLLRNPLAEPGLLGISSGASLGAVVAIYFGFVAALPLAAPVFALVGAFVAAGIVLLLARTGVRWR
ncbi:iron chelate uptake ABC transporter family permease subunit [Novosphingobium panipatense]|uniref:iron chelate uptake ABC transporter family permease subunit n=1 Tax=Novosphingobium panipatense TaxID=428991 RepID=UPI003621BE48